jgi:hypothetical protein
MPIGIPTRRPDDAEQGRDGLWKRPQTRWKPNGETYTQMVLCCEDCWEPMPKYVGAANGYVSPESNSKLRAATIEGLSAVEAVAKLVCAPCHKLAFERFYPVGVPYPHISDVVAEE